MSKRIVKAPKKKVAKKVNSSKVFKFNLVKHEIKLTQVKCITCDTQLEMNVLSNLVKDDEYFVPICLFCHPITTKKNIVVTDNEKLKRFIDKCKEQGE